MKKSITFKNVVLAESTTITTYPQWSDYGCLTRALHVIYKNDEGEYVDTTIVTEDVDPYIDYYEVSIENYIDVSEWEDIKAKERLGKDGFYAKPGDLLEVVKGRKYPKGFRFIFDERISYTCPNTYGRVTVYYCNGHTSEGDKVHVLDNNCIIVGRAKQ